VIDSISIKNFQSHEDTTLELSDGINVIVGSSDSGKSCIIRALDWVRTNRPLGTSIMRRGTKDVSVTIKRNNGAVITRSRDGRNGYEVNDKTYEAIGNAVPEEVTRALNLSDINVQRQLSAHYLVVGSPGQVADVINTVIKLSDGTQLADNVQRQIRNTTKDLADKQAELEKEQRLLASPTVKLIPKLEKEQKRIESIEKNIESTEEQIEELQFLCVQIEEAEACLLPDIEIPERFEQICNELAETEEAIEKLQDKIEGITSLYNGIVSLEKQIEETEDGIAEKQQELEDLMDKLKLCPLCNQPLDKKTKMRLINA
jgi:DNA repair protein SbcC/Rad50